MEWRGAQKALNLSKLQPPHPLVTSPPSPWVADCEKTAALCSKMECNTIVAAHGRPNKPADILVSGLIWSPMGGTAFSLWGAE